jgi:DNA-binding NarL/FixJ family response regulator
MSLSPIRVLLVDDHTRLRGELCRIVEEDHQLAVIGEANDGEMAMQLAGRLYPDIVIMDVQMPKMNGIEATRRIKEAYPEIAVIGLSSSDHAEAMIQAGASAYILKHRALEELCSVIQRVAESHRRRNCEADTARCSYSLLILDDDAVFLNAISAALDEEHRNISIETASSAEHGLRLLAHRSYDAVISDFRMAGLNGVDLLKECAASSPGTPVILITGYGTPALEQDALNQGAWAVVHKPVNPEQLYALVTRVIRRSKWLSPTNRAVPLHDLQRDELAQRHADLSERIRKVTRRLQDTLHADDTSRQ